jgi:hypothetical protein
MNDTRLFHKFLADDANCEQYDNPILGDSYETSKNSLPEIFIDECIRTMVNTVTSRWQQPSYILLGRGITDSAMRSLPRSGCFDNFVSSDVVSVR